MIKYIDKDGNISEFEGKDTLPILPQIKGQDAHIDSQCHRGVCGICMCKIKSGADNIDKQMFGQVAYNLDPDIVLVCRAGIKDPNKDIVLEKI